MPFKKGEPSPNPKGRPVNTKKPIKTRIENLIETNLDCIEIAMENAPINDRIGFVLGLSKLI